MTSKNGKPPTGIPMPEGPPPMFDFFEHELVPGKIASTFQAMQDSDQQPIRFIEFDSENGRRHFVLAVRLREPIVDEGTQIQIARHLPPQ
jgi:hypothetical protein